MTRIRLGTGEWMFVAVLCANGGAWFASSVALIMMCAANIYDAEASRRGRTR